ncbi:MAG: hypothetical protein IT458_16250 [Planctomycetes bacterium]|nr:hypothetical protein [Planctomycetota bacterium]
MRLASLSALVLGGIASLASAQTPCATLAITGSGHPGTDLTIALTSQDKNAPAVLFVGQTAGSTTFEFGPLGSLTLGLAQPFVPVMLGATDGAGKATLVVRIPPGNIPPVQLKGQGTTVRFAIRPPTPPALNFCTSNVASFSVGGGS